MVRHDLRVLLVCGSGASSGFMAANMRKASKELGYDFDVEARGSSEIESHIDDVDVIMVGPHMEYIMDEAKELTEGTGVKAILMKPDYYSHLDGKKAIEHLLEELKG